MANLFKSLAPISMFVMMLMEITGCSNKTITPKTGYLSGEGYLSEYYNHFEGGMLFTDVQVGLMVLWNASFKNGRAFKENLGFLVEGGLIILPNSNNTLHRSQFNASTYVEHNKLYIRYQETALRVIGIVHTHPDGTGRSEPTPGKDYQYAYLGMHNYIISKHHLYDAFYNARGREVYYRIGSGKSIYKSSPVDILRLSSNP